MTNQINNSRRVKLIATSRHPHRKEGEVINCDPAIAKLFLSKGYAMTPDEFEVWRVKPEPEVLAAAAADVEAHRPDEELMKPKRGRKRKIKCM